MNTEQCKAFCTVYETGSFARAAQVSYVTSQSISQQVKRLEREVGAELFERGSTGVAPTAAGREFYAWCCQALRSVDDVKARCRAIGGTGSSRSIRLGISHDHTLSLYKRFVSRYLQQEGALGLEYVDLGPVEPIDRYVESLRGDRVDVLEWIDPCEPDMGFVPLTRTRRCCLMSACNPLSRKRAVSAEDLLGQKVYVYSTLWTQNLRAWLDEHDFGEVRLNEVGAPDAPALLRSYLNDKAIYLLPEHLAPLYESLFSVPLDIDVCTEYGLAYLKENEGLLADLLACARRAFA